MRALAILVVTALSVCAQDQTGRWSEDKARAWYSKQPWLVGANYAPATAINQLEMWQADTFDPNQIEKELGWAKSIGMNTMRVFLHDALWETDTAAYLVRIDEFLRIASRQGIRPMLVLFDSVWDPFPKLGKQRAPKPGVHNSGWVQGPGAEILKDPSKYPALEQYVKGVVAAFANDQRILAWDVWNEPDNMNGSSYGKYEPQNKVELVNTLLTKVFEWARAAKPSQPLTCGVWKGDWSSDSKLSLTEHIQLENSDVISFHNYEHAAEFEKRIKWLERFKRPILCTEYMARGNKSTFQGSLPVAKKYNVAAYNWGFVVGKTQTHLPWDSWKQPYVNGREPSVWFHEVFHADGRPYREDEVALIRELTGVKAKGKAAGAGR